MWRERSKPYNWKVGDLVCWYNSTFKRTTPRKYHVGQITRIRPGFGQVHDIEITWLMGKTGKKLVGKHKWWYRADAHNISPLTDHPELLELFNLNYVYGQNQE